MPGLSDQGFVVSDAMKEQQNRTLIMVNTATQTVLYASFTYGFDHAESVEAVAQLFDESCRIADQSTLRLFTKDTLPIVKYLGRYKITIVEKWRDGSVTISDGEKKSVDHYIGVGE